MRPALAIVLVLLGCGESKSEAPAPAPAAAPPVAAARPPDAAPAPAPSGPTEVVLTDGGASVTITLTPPPGWKLQPAQPNHVAMNNGDLAAPAWVKVLLTCHGACGDAVVLAANIEKVATERFDFTRSDGFVPRLAPEWDQEPAAASPGVIRWAFHGAAVSGEDWNLRQVAVERILEAPSGPRVLECMVETTRQTPEVEAQLAKLCAELPIAPAP